MSIVMQVGPQNLHPTEMRITVIPSLPASDNFAFDEEDLLVLRKSQDFVSRNPTQNIRQILRHPVIPGSEDLYDPSVIDERVRLRAVNL